MAMVESVVRKRVSPSEETKQKISNTLKKYFDNPQVKKKLSKLNSGKNNPNYGNHLSFDMRKKLHNLRSGRNNPGYKHGNHPRGYDFIFNINFKKEIILRDNACMVCGSNDKLHVHHIDYNKLNTLQENCVCLCPSCHCKTNFNRSQWINFFHSLLSEKYGYKYLEVYEI